MGALVRADAMGLLSQPVYCLDGSAMRGLARDIAQAGIGHVLGAGLQDREHLDMGGYTARLEAITEALEQSPAPSHEWPALDEVLESRLLCRLLGISSSSAQRYRTGSRATPDPVAARLHFLAMLVGDLAGAYNGAGIRRWFDRPRTCLDGRTPAQALGEGWAPEDEGPRQARELARALTSSPVT